MVISAPVFFFLFQIYILFLGGWVELKTDKTMDGHELRQSHTSSGLSHFWSFIERDPTAFISWRMWMNRLRSINIFLLVGKACWVSSERSWDSAPPSRCVPEVHLSSKREFLLIAMKCDCLSGEWVPVSPGSPKPSLCGFGCWKRSGM